MKFNGASPVLVTVTKLGEMATPTRWLPKATGLATLSNGPMPVPLEADHVLRWISRSVVHQLDGARSGPSRGRLEIEAQVAAGCGGQRGGRHRTSSATVQQEVAANDEAIDGQWGVADVGQRDGLRRTRVVNVVLPRTSGY